MNELKKSFEDVVINFKKLDLKSKQQETIERIKELLGTMHTLAEDMNIEYVDLLNREIIDVTKDNYTEDDYAEAIYVYLESIKEVYSKIMIEIINGFGSEE